MFGQNVKHLNHVLINTDVSQKMCHYYQILQHDISKVCYSRQTEANRELMNTVYQFTIMRGMSQRR